MLLPATNRRFTAAVPVFHQTLEPRYEALGRRRHGRRARWQLLKESRMSALEEAAKDINRLRAVADLMGMVD